MKSDTLSPAVVLLSGGLDSATVLALTKAKGYDAYALSFRYGQRHEAELRAASQVATHLQVREHRIVDIDLRQFGGSALTDDINVPKDRPANEIGKGIPVTYVPARNTIFLALSLAWAEILGSNDIFTGVNALDYSGYPDCRPEYIEAFQRMANLATKAAVEDGRKITIHTPLLSLSKTEIITTGLELGVNYALTLSCYDPSAKDEACGRCDACQLRLKGFRENGLADPARYCQVL